MYLSLISSSNYDDDDDVLAHVINDDFTKDICLICWMSYEDNNKLKILSDFSHITTKCNCKSKIHFICLNIWIKKTPSCPICRTKIKINIFNSEHKNIFVNYYIEYKIYILKILCFVSFINLLFITFYNIYSIYYFSKIIIMTKII